MAMNDLPKRAATAVIFVIVMIGGLVWNRYSFLALTTLITAGCLWEYYGLVSKVQTYPENKKGLLRGLYTIVGVVVFLSFISVTLPFIDTSKLLFLIFPVGGIILVAEIFGGGNRSFQNTALNLFGIIYIVVPLGLLHYLTFRIFGNDAWFPNTSGIILGMLILVWTNDTMAYFTGRFLGRNKLFPSISPGKTWEGFIGGVIFCLIVGYLLSLYLTNLSLVDWLVIALIMSVIGTLGDLFESMIKRNLDVKDSGTLMPGHGGLLDRFDAFIFSIPFVFAYIALTHW